MSQHRQKQNEIKRDNHGHHTVFTTPFSFAKARFWLPRRCDKKARLLYEVWVALALYPGGGD